MSLCDSVSSWSRLLVEKPFGKDLATAIELEHQLCSLFADNQIYRIDHYLAKDAIENIIALRFSNAIVADSWNKEQIESIAIRLFETKNVSNRGAFYDDIGTLRDVGQNHLLQIFALLTMSDVNITDAASVREARTRALGELVMSDVTSLTRGQYDGYKKTIGVEPGSQTETYFEVVLQSKSELWAGVQLSLSAGKALDRAVNEAIVTFSPYNQCHCGYESGVHQHQNTLRITFSPEQEISLSMWVKKPGFNFVLEKKELVLTHQKDSADTYSPEAYERVLYDCIAGDQTRFVSGAEVEAAWQFITPLLKQLSTLPLEVYPQGSAGPKSISHK
jgi:glucose-6-phosphate 1-dehydrogenase